MGSLTFSFIIVKKSVPLHAAQSCIPIDISFYELKQEVVLLTNAEFSNKHYPLSIGSYLIRTFEQ